MSPLAMELSRKDVIAALKRIRRSLCVYAAPGSDNFCDCKFGAKEFTIRGEEGNGCPEVRLVIAFLEAMTDEEYARIQKRHFKELLKQIRKLPGETKRSKPAPKECCIPKRGAMCKSIFKKRGCWLCGHPNFFLFERIAKGDIRAKPSPKWCPKKWPEGTSQLDMGRPTAVRYWKRAQLKLTHAD